MTINTTWMVDNMTHNNVDGGVILVYWSCVAVSDSTPSYTATEAGKLRLEPNASAADFVAYEDLTEAIVLGWVYNSLIEGEETANEAKSRIEANRTAKVQSQIDRANTQAVGLPWVS